MPPIAKWTRTPPLLAHTLHAPMSQPPHVVSQSSQCEYMNTVNCSDRVNYSVCYQATKHQNALWLPTTVNMEIWWLGLVQLVGRWGRGYFSRCSNHRSSHLILFCVRFAIIFFVNRSQIDALSLSWLPGIDQEQHLGGHFFLHYVADKQPGSSHTQARWIKCDILCR